MKVFLKKRDGSTEEREISLGQNVVGWRIVKYVLSSHEEQEIQTSDLAAEWFNRHILKQLIK